MESFVSTKKALGVLGLLIVLIGAWAGAVRGQDVQPDAASAWSPEERICQAQLVPESLATSHPKPATTQGLRTWDIVTIDGNAGHPSIALDAVGRPHISFASSGQVRHAWYDGTDWQIETVVDSCFMLYPYTSMSLDSMGRPHIAYSCGYVLEYADYDGAKWRTEVVDSDLGESGGAPSLALDASNQPHISYFDAAAADLMYAHRIGSGWQIETVPSEGYAGLYNSLALDSAGRPRIAFSDPTAGAYALQYAYHDGSQWHVETVQSAQSDVGRGLSLVLDASDRPHISYYKGYSSYGYLMYAHQDGSEWVIQTVAAADPLFEDTSLALDASGQPHIAYNTEESYEVRYAYWADGAWHARFVDRGSNVCFVSIVVDGSGQPLLAYTDWSALKLATPHFDLAGLSRLAFASYRDGNWEVYAGEGDGTHPQRLTNNSRADSRPALNRSGSQVVFISNRDGNYEVYRMNRDGSGQVRLTNTKSDEYDPTWSPDGSRIAYYAYRDDSADVFVMNADGSNQTRLTYEPGWDGYPTWSPDGDRIAFVSDRSGRQELWVMDADGSNPQQLTSGISYAAYPDWSPDGRRIAFNDDMNGDGWLDVAVIGVNGAGLTHPLGTSPAKYDYLAPVWAPHGDDLAFAKVQWILYSGNWYWVDAYVLGRDLAAGYTYGLADSAYDWWPDWQPTDSSAPSSQVAPLPAWSGTDISVTWSGSDTGVGLASYDVQVRDGVDGTWTDWLVDTEETSGSFAGQGGHVYSFRCRARDHFFNLEPYPGGDGDTSTTVDVTPPSSLASSPRQANEIPFLVTWSGSDAGSGIASYDVQVREGSGGMWTDWWLGTTAPSAFFEGELGHTYYFRCRARDRAGNVEPYPGGDGDTVTDTPRYSVTGRILETRGGPVSLARVGGPPLALNTAVSRRGVFSLYFNQEGSCAIQASHSRFGTLPPMNDVAVGASSPPVVLYLPPADDRIADGGFETGSLAAWTTGGEISPVLTDTAHTGDWAVLLGGPAQPPQVSGHRALPAVVGEVTGELWQSTLTQEVTLPSDTERSTLSLLYQVRAANPLSDSLQIILSDVGHAVTFTLPLTTGGWTHFWQDVSSWEGPTATVRLIWSQSSANHPSEVVVDEISLGLAPQGAFLRFLPLVGR